MTAKSRRVPTLAALVFFFFAAARAEWNIAPNPVSGLPEAVWTDPGEAPPAARVLYSRLTGNQWAPPITLSDVGSDEAGPALAFAPDGGRVAVWGTTAGQVVLRKCPSAGGPWGSPILASDVSEASSRPSVAVFLGDTFVSYETAAIPGHREVVVSKIDPGSNVERSVVAQASSNAPLHSRLHVWGGHVWVEWIASESAVGFAIRDGDGWGAAQYEIYEQPLEISSVHERIRERVLGG